MAEQDLYEHAVLVNSMEDYIAREQRCDEFIESSWKNKVGSNHDRDSTIADCSNHAPRGSKKLRGRFVHANAGCSAHQNDLCSVRLIQRLRVVY